MFAVNAHRGQLSRETETMNCLDILELKNVTAKT